MSTPANGAALDDTTNRGVFRDIMTGPNPLSNEEIAQLALRYPERWGAQAASKALNTPDDLFAAPDFDGRVDRWTQAIISAGRAFGVRVLWGDHNLLLAVREATTRAAWGDGPSDLARSGISRSPLDTQGWSVWTSWLKTPGVVWLCPYIFANGTSPLAVVVAHDIAHAVIGHLATADLLTILGGDPTQDLRSADPPPETESFFTSPGDVEGLCTVFERALARGAGWPPYMLRALYDTAPADPDEYEEEEVVRRGLVAYRTRRRKNRPSTYIVFPETP